MGNLIVKDNALIEASYKLGEIEQKLVLLAVLKAREVGDTVEQLKDKMLIIHADDYITNFGGTRQGAYKALKQAVMGLYRAEWGYKYLTQKGEQRVRYERFTQSADYGEGEGVITFMFANAIIPMLVELEKRFTTYEIEQVARLSSQYAIRLYEFFVQHLDKKSGKGWLDISLDELRFRFGLLPTEYKRMDNFKRKILDHSISDLNKNTDLTVTYTQQKKGRVIVGFNFSFETKKQEQTRPIKQKSPAKSKKTVKNTDKDTDTPNMLHNLTDKELVIVCQQVDEYIGHLKDKGKKVTDFHQKNITKKAIDERWGLDEYYAKLEKEQKRLQKIEQERLEKQQKEQQRKEQLERDRQADLAFMAYFESLDKNEQYRINELVIKEIAKNKMLPLFHKKLQMAHFTKV